MGSKLSEFILEMCPVHGHKRLDEEVFLASLSRSRKVTVSRADAPGCRPVGQYALFTLTPNLSRLIVINPVSGKNLEHPPLTR